MKKLTRLLALLLAAMMVISLAACSSDSSDTDDDTSETTGSSADSSADEEEADEDVDKTIRVGITTDLGGFAPWEAFNYGQRHVLPMIYQTLISDVQDPETGDITTYYVLISGYEQTGDYTYELYLREGIYDTDGNSFTASDVVFCLESFKERGNSSAINAMESAAVIDDYTVEIVVTESLGVGEFEEMLAAPNMLTQAAYEASEDGMTTYPVGTTGYVLEEYVEGSSITFVKADSYWNEEANETKSIEDGYCPTSDTTNVDTVIFEIITDTSTMAVALESGEIDIATSITTTDADAYMSSGDYTIYSVQDNIMSLCFNVSDGHETSDINLRRAIAYAISAEDLLEFVYDGHGLILSAVAYPGQHGYLDSWEEEEYFVQDLDAAQEYLDAYLEETGQTADELSLTLLTLSTDAYTDYATVVQAALIELTGNQNVLTITTVDSASIDSAADGDDWDLLVRNDLANKSYVNYVWNARFNDEKISSGMDAMHSDDETLHELVRAAMESLDEDTVAEFQDYLNEQCYYISYICGYTYWAGNSKIVNWAQGAKLSCAVTAITYDWSAE